MKASKDALKYANSLLAFNPMVKKGGKGWLLLLYTAQLMTTPITCPSLRNHYSKLIAEQMAIEPSMTIKTH